MKKTLIALAVAAMTLASCNNAPEKGEANDGSNPVIDNIMARTSIRSYTDEKLTEDQITTILKAAMAAPSGMNVQPWHFVVLTDTSEYTGIFGEGNFNLRMYKDAAAVIVTCADTTFKGRSRDGGEAVVRPNGIWRDDMGAVSENILLAATSLGIGSVWTACYPYPERYMPVKNALGLPAEVLPYSVIVLGYSDSEVTPKDKWKPERIHQGRW